MAQIIFWVIFGSCITVVITCNYNNIKIITFCGCCTKQIFVTLTIFNLLLLLLLLTCYIFNFTFITTTGASHTTNFFFFSVLLHNLCERAIVGWMERERERALLSRKPSRAHKFFTSRSPAHSCALIAHCPCAFNDCSKLKRLDAKLISHGHAVMVDPRRGFHLDF